MTPEERITRIEQALDKHIEFVGASLTRLEEQVAKTSQQVDRTATAQEVTEERLQRLIGKIDEVDGRVDKLEKD